MKTRSTKVTKATGRKQSNARNAGAALATCPVNNAAGWCAYPFSVAQLEKKLKKIADESKVTEPVTPSGR